MPTEYRCHCHFLSAGVVQSDASPPASPPPGVSEPLGAGAVAGLPRAAPTLLRKALTVFGNFHSIIVITATIPEQKATVCKLSMKLHDRHE